MPTDDQACRSRAISFGEGSSHSVDEVMLGEYCAMKMQFLNESNLNRLVCLGAESV